MVATPPHDLFPSSKPGQQQAVPSMSACKEQSCCSSPVMGRDEKAKKEEVLRRREKEIKRFVWTLRSLTNTT